jgi:hypothetical protein
MKRKLLVTLILSSLIFFGCTNDLHIRVTNSTLDNIDINGTQHILKGLTDYVFTLTPETTSDSFVICRRYNSVYPCLARVTVTMIEVPGGGRIGGHYQNVTITESPRDIFSIANTGIYISADVENLTE